MTRLAPSPVMPFEHAQNALDILLQSHAFKRLNGQLLNRIKIAGSKQADNNIHAPALARGPQYQQTGDRSMISISDVSKSFGGRTLFSDSKSWADSNWNRALKRF